MERWRPETNTFHMYHGECSLTLHDVAHLTGLSVTGDVLYVEYEKKTNWAAIVEEVLRKFPGGHLKGDGRVKIGWLHDHFYSCTGVDEIEFRQYVCAYMPWRERYLPYLQEVGLLPFEGLAAFTLNPHLITTLMERWRPETNTFHMYHGECSLTLHDVAHLTGLSVTGDALYVEYEKKTNWAAIVEEVLGKFPGGDLKGDGRVKIGWLHDHFYSCTGVDEIEFRHVMWHCPDRVFR
ncbi:Serine/threonine-protein phosphatase 7 long form homolog [Linum grandiflorum]